MEIEEVVVKDGGSGGNNSDTLVAAANTADVQQYRQWKETLFSRLLDAIKQVYFRLYF